jgi:hypothetical protein
MIVSRIAVRAAEQRFHAYANDGTDSAVLTMLLTHTRRDEIRISAAARTMLTLFAALVI